MPPVIAAAISGIAVGLGAIGAEVVIFGLGLKLSAALIGFAVFALGTASSLIQQNKASYEQRIGGLLVSQRASVTPGRLIFGTVRTGGPITAMFTSDWLRTATLSSIPQTSGLRRKQNSYLHMVITLAWLPIDEVLTVFLDDYPIHLKTMVNSSGQVIIGKFFNPDNQIDIEYAQEQDIKDDSAEAIARQTRGRFNVQIQVDTGNLSTVGDLSTYQPFPDLTTRVPEWTIAHKQLGRAKLYIRLLYDPGNIKMWPSGVPNITAYYKGKSVLDPRDDTIEYTANPALILRNMLVIKRRLGGFAINNTDGSSVIEIDEDSFIAAANNADEEVLVNSFTASAWRNMDVFTGTNFTYLDEDVSPSTYTYFPALLSNDANTRGIDINTGDKISILGSGNPVPTGLSVSVDYYIILKGIGQGLSKTAIDELGGRTALTTEETKQLYQVGFASTYLNAIRDIPIESAEPNIGSTVGDLMPITKIAEARYQCAAVIEFDRAPQDYISDILSSMGARLVYPGGKFSLASYEFFTPTISFDESDIRKPFHVDTKVSRRNRFNIVKGLYTSIATLGRPTNYPSAQRALHITNDNDEELFREFNFPNTPSQTMAQRLARIELEKHRQEIVVTLPLSLVGFLVKAGDNILLSIADMGWTNKAFEILEWTFLVDRDAEGEPIVGVDVVAKETASAIWDWDETQDEVDFDLSDDTDLPDGSFIAAPTNLSVAETLFTTSSGSYVQVRLTLSWNASEGPFLNNYEIQFKRSSETDWQNTAASESTSQEINDVETATTYNLRVRAVNTLGIPSEWLTLNHEVFGLSAPPGDVQNCRMSTISTLAFLTWDPTVDDDVRLGGRILVRHDEDTVSGDWINSVSIGGGVGLANQTFTCPLKIGTYLLKFRDSAEFASVNACSIVVTSDGSLDGFQTLDTITESPTFGGTHSNTVVADGLLRLEMYSDVSPSTEVLSSGTYTFGNAFNFGAQKFVRITPTISVTIVDENDLIDSRLDNIDDWASFDGVLGEDADAQVFIRSQITDPAASPTPEFTEWQPIDSASYAIWAAEFKVELTSSDSSANIHIDTLSVVAEEPLAL